MKALVKKIWHDPVGSKVIANGIIVLFGLSAAGVAYLLGWLPQIKAFLTIQITLSLWIVTGIALLALVQFLLLLQKTFNLLFPAKSSPHKLLEQLTADTSDDTISATQLLRNASEVAKKLKDTEANDWIRLELDGYIDVGAKKLPKYRQAHGELKALNPYRGWEPVQFTTAEMREMFTYVPCGSPVRELEISLQKEDAEFEWIHSPKQKHILMEAVKGATDCKLIIDRNVFEHIVRGVRIRVRDWATKKLTSIV